MPRLGISIYPEKASFEENQQYLKMASQYGFTRVFTCLLSAKGDVNEIKEEYRRIIEYANSLGMEVVIDVSPTVFDTLNISYDDLSFFHEIGASGIRLDNGFDGLKEAEMTYNPYGLKIEFNASIYNNYLDHILSLKANHANMISCHNFYPQKYSGLSLELFKKCNQKLRSLHIPIAAFVSSQVEKSFGPWDISEGLCTLEMHRNLPIDAQARHLFALGVDDVIVANCFASEEELKQLSTALDDVLTIKIEELCELSEIEREIAYEYPHFVRPDMSDYMARSTFCRITYQDAPLPPNNANVKMLHRGDVVILNDKYGRYKGELHLVLQNMKNEGDKNLIGCIPQNQLFMLEFIEPFIRFKLVH